MQPRSVAVAVVGASLWPISAFACDQGVCEPRLGLEGPWCQIGSVSTSRCVRLFDHLYTTWCGACWRCRELGGRLVTINSQSEQDTLANMTHDANIWIGLHQADNTSEEPAGAWMWQDGSPATFTQWQRGEPNDWDENENCAVMEGEALWNDESCAQEMLYMCEFSLDNTSFELALPCPNISCELEEQEFFLPALTVRAEDKTFERIWLGVIAFVVLCCSGGGAAIGVACCYFKKCLCWSKAAAADAATPAVIGVAA